MLVLSRKTGEAIVLPDGQVKIVVLGIRGKRVRIGIEAPLGQSVYRAELWVQKQEMIGREAELLAAS